MEKELAVSAFGITPVTVYGFLVGLLVLAVIIMAHTMRMMYTKNLEIITQNGKIIEGFRETVAGLKSALDTMYDPEKKKLRNEIFMHELSEVMEDKFMKLYSKLKNI